MENGIRILHLEDNPSDSQLVQSVLRRANIEFEYFLVDNEKDYISSLKDRNIDIILSTNILTYAKQIVNVQGS